MKSIIFRNHITLGFFLGFFILASAEIPAPIFGATTPSSSQSSESVFQDWIAKYGSPSAIEAHHKTYVLTETGKEMKNLLNKIAAGEISDIEVTSPDDGELNRKKSTLTPVWQVYGYDDRDLQMLARIHRTIKNADQDELVIVFVGETHALDYFFKIAQGPRPDIIYVGMPVQTETQNFSEEMVQLLDLLNDLKKTSQGIEIPNEFLRKAHTSKTTDALSGYIIPLRYAAAVHAAQGKPKLEPSQSFLSKLETPTVASERPKVIFIMDYHELRSVDHILSMPSIDSLSKTYSKVTLSFEGYNPSQQIPSANYLMKREYWSSFNVATLGLLTEAQSQLNSGLTSGLTNDGNQLNNNSLSYYRQLLNRVEDGIRFLNEGRVTHHPSEHAILYKMK
jgi:hypothetical protein